jgi:integrase
MRGKGESSVFKDARGLWTASIELPSADGKRRRKVVRRKEKKALLLELARLKGELGKRGDLPTADQTVGQWFTYWYNEIAVKEVRPNTATNYRTVMEKYIIPTIGNVRLEKVTSATIRKVTSHMTDDLGLSSTYALNAHRILSTAFEMAMREGRIGRNPAKLTSAPPKAIANLETLDLAESIRVLKHTASDPLYGPPIATSLLTAARRGEVVGIEDDRMSDTLDLSWQLQRLIWRHGCKTSCGRIRGVDCPERRIIIPASFDYRHVVDGLYLTRPKSNAGWRIIPLVDPLRSMLEEHRATKQPNPHGLLFADANNRPIDPDQYSAKWQKALDQVGIEKSVRLHDLRHATIDLLYLAGVPEDVIIEIVGHAGKDMARAYKRKGNLLRLTAGMNSLSELFTQQPEQTPGTPQGMRELDAS